MIKYWILCDGQKVDEYQCKDILSKDEYGLVRDAAKTKYGSGADMVKALTCYDYVEKTSRFNLKVSICARRQIYRLFSLVGYKDYAVRAWREGNVYRKVENSNYIRYNGFNHIFQKNRKGIQVLVDIF